MHAVGEHEVLLKFVLRRKSERHEKIGGGAGGVSGGLREYEKEGVFPVFFIASNENVGLPGAETTL